MSKMTSYCSGCHTAFVLNEDKYSIRCKKCGMNSASAGYDCNNRLLTNLDLKKHH